MDHGFLKKIEPLASLCWFGLCLLVMLFYTKSEFLRPTDDPKELFLYGGLFLVFILLSLFILLKNKKVSLVKTNADILFVALLLYQIVNLFFVGTTFSEGLATTGRFSLLALAVWFYSFYNEESFEKLILSVVICGFLAICYTVFQGSLIQFFTRSVYKILPIGHISYFADFLLLLLPWTIYLSGSRNRGYLKWVFRIFSLALVFLIFFSGRRSSLIGLLVSFIVALFLWQRIGLSLKRVLKLLILPIISVIIFLVVMQVLQNQKQDRHQTLVDRLSKTVTGFVSGKSAPSPRMTFYKRSFKAITQKPMTGWGYGSFKYVYPRFAVHGDPDTKIFKARNRHWVMHPHNDILYQLFEGGIIGFGLFYGLVFLLWWTLGAYVLKNTKSPDLYFWAFIGLSGVFISFQFNTTSTNPVIRLMLIPYFAVAYKAMRKTYSLSKEPRFVFKSLVMLLLYGVTIWSFLPSWASYYLKQASHEFSQKKKSDLHLKAIALDPWGYNSLSRGGSFEMRNGRFKEAQTLLIQAKGRFPYVPMVYSKLARTYMLENQYQKAYQVLQEGLTLYPFYAPYLKSLEMIPPVFRKE